jgi:hypothetical protein
MVDIRFISDMGIILSDGSLPRQAAPYAGPVLRRRSTTSSAETAPEASGSVDLTKPGGKGRPTPKRNAAQKQRRQAVRPPADRKEARARMREDRARRMDAMKRGDESALPARDRGPVRRHVREIVDSRRNVAEFFMPVVLVVLVLTAVPGVAALVMYIWLAMLVGVVADSVWLRRLILRSVAERFPGADTKGAVGYGLMRALQVRALRLPKPTPREPLRRRS